MKKALLKFLPFVYLITVFCLLTFITAQQLLLQNANDPQIQISEDVAAQIEGGQDPKGIAELSKINMAKSLSPFVIVFGADKKVIANESELNGSEVLPPAGTLDGAEKKGSNRFSWEPEKGTRIAAVITKYKDGYVLAGRNMREIEKRINLIGLLIAAAWFMITVGMLAVVLLKQRLKKALSSSKQPKQEV